MKTIAYIRWADPPLWKATLADFLPLWLLSITLTATSLVPSRIAPTLAGVAFWLAIAVIILLLWIRWFTPELVLYSLFPIIPAFIFDEMSPSYETPFTLMCALLLSAGIVSYRLSLHRGSPGLGWLLLLAVFVGAWMLASHANQNYWQMVSDLGFTCASDTLGCATFTGNETPWWVLFFRFTT